MVDTVAALLKPSSFVETETCPGPLRVPIQPNRETPGVTLNQCQACWNKYGVSWNLSTKEVMGSLTALKNRWAMLNENERKMFLDLLYSSIPELNVVNEKIIKVPVKVQAKERFTQNTCPDVPTIVSCLTSIPGAGSSQQHSVGDTKGNTVELLKNILNPGPGSIAKIKDRGVDFGSASKSMQNGFLETVFYSGGYVSGFVWAVILVFGLLTFMVAWYLRRK